MIFFSTLENICQPGIASLWQSLVSIRGSVFCTEPTGEWWFYSLINQVESFSYSKFQAKADHVRVLLPRGQTFEEILQPIHESFHNHSVWCQSLLLAPGKDSHQGYHPDAKSWRALHAWHKNVTQEDAKDLCSLPEDREAQLDFEGG